MSEFHLEVKIPKSAYATRRLTILVDMDGVVADFDNYIVEKYNLLHPESQIPKCLIDNSRLIHPLQTEEYRDRLNDIMCLPNFFAEIPVLPGAVEAVNAMKAEGHQIYFVTSPKTSNPTCADDKLRWIRKYFGHDMRHNTIISKDKTAILGDLLFDDRISITGGCKPIWQHYLFSTPFNAYVETTKRVSWDTWREVVSTFLTNN